jgi:hypothetical protein
VAVWAWAADIMVVSVKDGSIVRVKDDMVSSN